MAEPTIKIKRSAVAGKTPTTDNLSLGELGLNTYDGKLFVKQDQGGVGIATTIIAINPWSVGVGSTAYNIYFTAGNVGVGTTNPTQRFTVQGSGSPEITTNLSGSDIRFTNTSSTSTIGGSISSKLGRSWSSLTSLQTEVLSLLPVDVNDSVTGGLRLIADGTVDASNRSALVLGGYYSGLADNNAITIRGTGLVGVNTATPTSKLHVVGDTLITGVATANGGFNLGISSAGTVITSGPVKTLNFVGTGNTFSVNGTTVNVSIAGGGGGASVTVSDTPPVSPSNGDLWWESDTGVLKIYYADGTSSQWVDASGVNEAAIFSRQTTSFTATEGQTSFSVTYTVNYIDVYVNGILLDTSEYTATTGSTVVLSHAATAGDIVIFITYGSVGSSYWNKNSNEYLYTTSTNVGIGTTNPTSTLTVTGDALIVGVTTANSFRARGGAPGAFGTSNNGYGFHGIGDNDAGMFSSADGQVEFYANSVEIFRYNNTGVGIGTANISYKLDVVGNARVTGILTVTSLNGGQLGGSRNMVINGSMVVNQRGWTGTAGTTTNQAYTTDRFALNFAHDGAVSAGQTTLTSGDAYADGFQNALILRTITGDATLAASQFQVIYQPIEGLNLQGIKKGTANAQPVTLSFWTRSSTTGTHICELYDIDNTRQVSQAYTINAANTWEKKVLTFPADTTGVFNNDNQSSLALYWWLAAGSTYSGGTLNTSWVGVTTANRVAGQVNGIATSGNSFMLTGVQLEVGSQATEFERRSYADELRLCQRYYETGDYGYIGGYTNSSVVASVYTPVYWKVTKRAAPNLSGTNDQGTFASTSATQQYGLFGRSNVVANRNNTGTYIAEIEL